MNATCILCQLKKYMEAAIATGDDAAATAFCHELIALYAASPKDYTSPVFAERCREHLVAQCGFGIAALHNSFAWCLSRKFYLRGGYNPRSQTAYKNPEFIHTVMCISCSAV